VPDPYHARHRTGTTPSPSVRQGAGHRRSTNRRLESRAQSLCHGLDPALSAPQPRQDHQAGKGSRQTCKEGGRAKKRIPRFSVPRYRRPWCTQGQQRWPIPRPPMHLVHPIHERARRPRATRTGRRSRMGVSEASACSARHTEEPSIENVSTRSSGVSASCAPVTTTVDGPLAESARALFTTSSIVVAFAPHSHSSSKWFGVIMSASGHRESRNIGGISACTNRPGSLSPRTGSQH
jgi:hypothetical protein